jgi:plasmid stability protein
MSKMVQIRNMPDEMHRVLKSRAAREGKSLSDYLLAELHRTAERPTLAEMLERLEHRPAENPTPTPTQAIREDRDSR